MTTIIPIPTGRTSELLVRQRLLAQIGDSQSGLLKLQTQISSGQRLILASEDAPAALRAIGLQQLLSRKTQAASNLATSQSFLAASDSALGQVSELLINARGTAQGVIGAVATNEQRSAVADQVQAALVQLTNTANREFRGRYLFAGSQAQTPPFQANSSGVVYRGNEGALPSYADLGLLLDTNADGDAVFGALSAVARGTVDLNPVLTDATRLSDLHLGAGIAKGKIAISDGTTTSIVDLSQAETIGDVIGKIQNNPPAGRMVTVTMTANGLDVQIDSPGGGSLSIKDVGGGTTAADLGIARQEGLGIGPFAGQDLNPRVTNSTALDDLLGTHARVTIVSPGAKNDLQISARQNGAAWNGVQISFVSNPTIAAGQEVVSYNANTRQLVVQINAGHSTVANVVAAINADPQVGAMFEATATPHDQGQPTDPATTFVDVTSVGALVGGSGTAFDRKSGMQITSGNQTYTIDTSQAYTVQDLLNKLNGSAAGVLAEINDQGTGVNVRSRVSGADFSIGENGGATASQLGIRTFTADTRLEDLNHGGGVRTLGAGQTDFVIRRTDGVELKIDVSQAKTVADVIDVINNHTANQVPLHKVTARLAQFGNGIELVSQDSTNVSPLAVIKTTTSQAAIDLGLIASGATTSAPAIASGGTTTLTGRDSNPGQVDGAFTALVRLEAALRNGDDDAIGQALTMLDSSVQRVNLARAELGARQQALDTLKAGLDAESITLKDSLSKEMDTDLPTAVSELTGRQAAFQAALQTAATISRLSLLDYL